MRILVIGSEGYLGSALVPHLRREGRQVDRMDLCAFSNPSPDMFYGDYNNFDKEIFRTYERIILLAGHSSVPLCQSDELGSFANNVTNFHSLLDKMIPGQRLLYASSASVCNGIEQAKEYTPLNRAICEYDKQKQEIEKIAASFPSIETVGMRFGTLSGYSPNPRLELMINSMAHDAYNGIRITVSNPNNKRSFLGIKDACNAISHLLEKQWVDPIYNIASGEGTIQEIANRISKYTATPIKLIPGNSSTYSFTLDCSKMRTVSVPRDTIESICDEVRKMNHMNKKYSNRSTVTFLYEGSGCILH